MADSFSADVRSSCGGSAVLGQVVLDSQVAADDGPCCTEHCECERSVRSLELSLLSPATHARPSAMEGSPGAQLRLVVPDGAIWDDRWIYRRVAGHSVVAGWCDAGRIPAAASGWFAGWRVCLGSGE